MARELETERLRLRHWRENDIAPFADFCASPVTMRYLNGPCSRDDAWRRMAAFAGHWSLRGYGIWVVEEKASRDFVGYSGLWNPSGWPEPEVVWGLKEGSQGRGFATEAARCARAFAYAELEWTTAISLIAVENMPSRRVAERLGAGLERTMAFRGHQVGVFRHPGPMHEVKHEESMHVGED